MSGGVSLRSGSAGATITGPTGTWSTDYPVTNLASLNIISKVARVTPAGGAAQIVAVLPAARSIQFAALVNHTAASGTIRFRFYSDAAMTTQVHDSGVVSIWPTPAAPVTGYRSVRPYLMPTPLTVRAVRIDLATLPGPIQIGAVEVGEWWEFDFSPGKSLGFRPRADSIPLLGGTTDTPDVWMPRIVSGKIDRLSLQIAATLGIDYQKAMGKAVPFVFCQDYADPPSWARSCMLARNEDLPPSAGAVYRHDTFAFKLVEHWR